MDDGLTQPEAAEVLTHLAFYTGWPSVSRRCRSPEVYSTSARAEGRALVKLDMERQTNEAVAISWVPDELQNIAATDDLHISPFREDGGTYGTPPWIWSVVVDVELYGHA